MLTTAIVPSLCPGWGRSQFSGDFVPFLRQTLNLALNHEDAIEMYYDAAITPWLNATADLQIIDPGLTKTLISTSQLLRSSRMSRPLLWLESVFTSGSRPALALRPFDCEAGAGKEGI